MLLLSYSVILPPIIFGAMCRDVTVKGDGFMIWHLDSIFALFQRFCFSILVFTSIMIYEVCDDRGNQTGYCVEHSLIPMMIPLVCVTFKIGCLKGQRNLLWGGFILAALA